MSEIVTLENVTYVPQHLWRVNFELPKFGPWSVHAYAKDMHIHNGKAIGETQKSTISRTLFDADGNPTTVCNETVTLADGTVISMAQIIEAGSLFGDKWRIEDDAAEQPTEA